MTGQCMGSCRGEYIYMSDWPCKVSTIYTGGHCTEVTDTLNCSCSMIDASGLL